MGWISVSQGIFSGEPQLTHPSAHPINSMIVCRQFFFAIKNLMSIAILTIQTSTAPIPDVWIQKTRDCPPPEPQLPGPDPSDLLRYSLHFVSPPVPCYFFCFQNLQFSFCIFIITAFLLGHLGKNKLGGFPPQICK